MKAFNKITLTLLIACLFLSIPFDKISAQGFSYVYIQGDKKTPIYTKVEGVMLPRYGKNYALISRLASGPLNVEILFQQNEYPPLQFTILVPENGKRAFLLNKNAEGFSLYDIEQNFSLKPNNDITDDHLPTVIKNVDIVTNVPIIEAIPEDDTSKEKWTIKKSAENVKKSINNVFTKIVGNEKKDIEPIDSPLVTKPDSAQSNFIENITFNNEQSNTSKDTTSNTNKSDLSLNGTTNTVVGITNSDCKGIISNVSYQKLLSSITGKKTEDERLGLILASARQNCFNTLQASELVRTLDSDVAKYSALKSIYPKTSNQSDFGNLEALLNSDEWKEYFRNLVTHGK